MLRLLLSLLLIFPFVLSVVAGLLGAVLANGTPAIDWCVMVGRGAPVEPGPEALHDTIGPALAGRPRLPDTKSVPVVGVS
jgi:hypothetical protein